MCIYIYILCKERLEFLNPSSKCETCIVSPQTLFTSSPVYSACVASLLSFLRYLFALPLYFYFYLINPLDSLTVNPYGTSCCVLTIAPPDFLLTLYLGARWRKSAETPEALSPTFTVTHTCPSGVGGFSACLKAAYVRGLESLQI